MDDHLDANVTVTVRALAQNDYFNFCADPTVGPYTLNVLTNDHFHRGYPGPGVITAVNEPLNGSEVTIAGGRLLFVPGPTGWDSVLYTVDDQYEATVHVSITGHLLADSFVVDQNSAARDLDVMDNDFSFDHRRACKSPDYLGPRLITAVSGSEHGGIVTVSPDGRSVHYQAPPDFHGDDSFTYTVDNRMQARAEVHVIRRVRDDHFRVESDSGAESLPVLVNDLFGADYPDAPQITAVSESSAGGTVAVGQDGQSIDYAPPPGFMGTDTFTYTVNGSLKAEVNVTIGSGQDEPFPRFDTLQAYQQFLIDDALIRYESLFGQPAWFGCLVCLDGEVAGRSQGGSPGRSHSETNVQVEGVDEGDIVEFDSDHVYVLTDEELVIVDAWPADELSVASRVELEGTPKVEFLNGDRLTVISQIGGDIFPWQRSPGSVDLVGRIPFPPTPASTIVTVLDVTDRLEPTVVQTTTMEGRYVESRAIGDYVYVLVRNDNTVAPPPLVITEEGPAPDGTDPPAGDVIVPFPSGVYVTEAEYLDRIMANLGQLVDDALPNYSSFGPDGELMRTGLLNDPEGIVRPLLADASNLISVVSFRVTADEPGLASTSGVYGSGASTVYASLDNFYVFDGDYSREDGALTRIMKFAWEAQTGGVDFAAAGVVPGSILNQFSADERGSFLRIATTISNQSSGNWSGRPENMIFVIQDDDGVFEFAGSLKNLALDETMRSIRYMGDRAFVTTFRDVDPLFGLDLSDPTNPRSVGYLTLPGFATYMQLIDGTHLLTVGRNTPGGFSGPTQVSLFDVSDLGRPQRIGEHTFARFSTSEAELDHHAFGYFAEHGLLAVPVSRQYIERIDADGDGYRETRSTVREEQLAILGIDPTADPAATGVHGAIQPIAEIQHDTPVRRSGYIGDKLYSIAVDSVKAVDVAEPGTVIDELIVVDDDDTDPPANPGGGSTAGGDPGGDDVNYPATLSSGPLASAVQRAQAHLAGHLQVSPGASMLVAAETARGGLRIVLRAADHQVLYRAIEDDVVLTNDDYAFPDGGRNRVWHAISPAPAEDTTPPRITAVILNGTTWSQQFRDAADAVAGRGYPIPLGGPQQLDVLPWQNVDQIILSFDEDVYVKREDLQLSGLAVPDHEIQGFSHDPQNHTVAWTLDRPIQADELTLVLDSAVEDAVGNLLDGEWTGGAGASVSGDGVAGGDYVFRFNVLTGDVDRNGIVEVADEQQIRASFGRNVNDASYSVFKDIDGNGWIVARDAATARVRLGTVLPTPRPGAPAADASASPTAHVPGRPEIAPAPSNEPTPAHEATIDALVAVAPRPTARGAQSRVPLRVPQRSNGTRRLPIPVRATGHRAGRTNAFLEQAGARRRSFGDFFESLQSTRTRPIRSWTLIDEPEVRENTDPLGMRQRGFR